jgi:hypothetical protein
LTGNALAAEVALLASSERIVAHSYKAQIDPAAPGDLVIAPKRPSGKCGMSPLK